eukprot:scaffold132402_cov33-Tisochrysis_lutea.AAC.1
MSTRTPAASRGGTVYSCDFIQSAANCVFTRILHDDHLEDALVTPSATRVEGKSSQSVGAEKS